MASMEIVDQVVDFYHDLFDRIFSQTFSPLITERLKRNGVIRQVQESADAASQSLTQFFLNQHISETEVGTILGSFSSLPDLIELEDISRTTGTPESMAEQLLTEIQSPKNGGDGAEYRLALHSIVQVLMLVGPVMVEWQKINFSTTFELPRKVVNRLNKISEQIETIGEAGQAAADERYELTYRDYLLQRFFRVDAGTVRMTTNLNIDLRDLFVMPRLQVRVSMKRTDGEAKTDDLTLMDLAQARERFGMGHQGDFFKKKDETEKQGIPALDHVLKYPRNVLIGPPGSGKSTFLEWLQVQLASVNVELVLGEAQAIPVLLRVRQLDPKNLPSDGSGIINLATASRDLASLMPLGWLERQMQNGRVFFMLDGLDETEPGLRDEFLIPWVLDLCRQYPDCRYLISSRPAGYPLGVLRPLEFSECDLLDFNDDEVKEYTQHWCTAVRLAQNEPEEEARREGEKDGGHIFEGFKDHPYIRNLAYNPLMLSAICLVNYFEGGKLPEDRALLYELCVEGLLHNWDQRRGILSPYRLDEKLRVCREVALAMQASDRAEFEAEKITDIFHEVLKDSEHAEDLFTHIRYRAGLLLERRAGIFAFAHLTFQEYLSACAVHEGNLLDITPEKLVMDHEDSRWQEVIALYCGIANTPSARSVLEKLMAQEDTQELSTVLTEAYQTGGRDLQDDREFRQKIIKRVAISPLKRRLRLNVFPEEEVIPVANSSVGTINSQIRLSESYRWLQENPMKIDWPLLTERVRGKEALNPFQLTELIYLVHCYGPDSVLLAIAQNAHLYSEPGLLVNNNQAEIALMGLSTRPEDMLQPSPGLDKALINIFRSLQEVKSFDAIILFNSSFLTALQQYIPLNEETWPEYASLARAISKIIERQNRRTPKQDSYNPEGNKELGEALNSWAGFLENKIVKQAGNRKKSRKNRAKKTKNK